MNKAYVVSCDLSPETGEGFLANSLINLVRTRFAVSVYDDGIVRALRSRVLLRDRVLPLYLCLVCLALRLGGHKVVLLNYVPIWNVLNAILASCGVRLGPITGSALIVPARAGFRDRFIRLHLQRVLIGLSAWVLPRKNFFWCATPSVYEELHSAGLRDLSFGFPFLGKIGPAPMTPKSFDLFVYSNTHPLKNHEAVLQFLANASTRDFKICFIGVATRNYTNVSAFSGVSEDEFNQLLARSRLYLTFSFEDAGITGFKALAYGIPLLCPRKSGLAFGINYEEPYCFADPYNSEDITSRALYLLGCEAVQQKRKMHETFSQLKEKYRESSIRWVSSL